MAIYHLSIKIFSRGKGRSAVAAAAYRSGELIKNEYNGTIHDYTRRSGVAHTEIMLPDFAPKEYSIRSVLWNAVEKVEKAHNSQLAREIEIALPVELTRGQNISLVRDYIKQNFVNAGMCADICIHDIDGINPHAHVMVTMRPFNEDGTWGDKQKKVYIHDENGKKIYDKVKRTYRCNKVQTTDWNEHSKVEQWRAAWAQSVNTALEQSGSASRVDHRSFERQGIKKIPSIKLGKAAHQMEKRGIRTERGDYNREVAITNNEMAQLKAWIRKTKDWINSQPITNAPTMADMMRGMNGGINLKTKWQKIANLKQSAQVLIFLQENGISNMEQLADKVTETHQRIYGLWKNIKTKERRLSKLNEHLAQVDIYNRYVGIYKKYTQLDSRESDAYKQKYVREIEQYESAHAYITAHLNGQTVIPEQAWMNERKSLLAERLPLVEEYYELKDDVKNIESLRRGAEDLMRDIMSKRARTITREL